ncbi:MAG: HAD family hydrolase [Aigarchaeota archaeon]|nr:HAD family hydrolase [Aigarchaeota archaeon]MCX8193634.1 HAD family hydrolase [Nitrososphaeria archaeon]MDW7987034.1 HAD family hydrolase [Nitrososphaerota archaeon]
MVEVDAVVFDVDGTLYRSKRYEAHLKEQINKVLGEILGIDYLEAARRLEIIKKKTKTVSLSVEYMGVDRKMFYERLAEKVNPSNYIVPRPEVRNLLLELRKMNIKIGCHTNSGKSLLLKVLEAIGIYPSDFDVLVTSDDASPKPMKDGYILLSNLLKTSFSRMLYVGDRWEVEVKPAKEIGMITAMVYSRRGDPDYYLEDVIDLNKIIFKRS